MTDARLYTVDELARVAGVRRGYIENWLRSGTLEPAVRGRPGGQGRGQRPHGFTINQLVAVVVARGLSAYGLPVCVGAEALDLLLGVSPDALESAFARGRSYLVILGHEVVGLRTEEEVLKSPTAKAAKAAGLPVFMVDVRAVAGNVARKVAEVDEERRAAPEAKEEPAPAMPAAAG